MKRFRSIIFAVAFLSACGGGGGNSSPSIPVPGNANNPPPASSPTASSAPTASPTIAPSPTAPPTATPPPTVVNSASLQYLPLSQGNVWYFDRGSITDSGYWQLNCACAYNSGTMEELKVSNGEGYQGSIYVTKTDCQAGITQNCAWDSGGLTEIIGTSTVPASSSCVSCITITDDASYPAGYPFIYNTPTIGDTWKDSSFTSTINDAGETQMLPNNQEVVMVATDFFTAPDLKSSIVWKFARGVGFTYISYNGQTAQLTSFYVDPRRSYSFGVSRSVSAKLGPLDFGILRRL